MKKRKNNIWVTIGIILVCVLLLYWLFARTIIVEDENLETCCYHGITRRISFCRMISSTAYFPPPAQNTTTYIPR